MPASEIEKLKKQKKKAEEKGNYTEVATICNYLGECLAKQGEYEDAIDEHQMELGLCESTGDTIGTAIANRKIGECHCELGQFDKALQFQQRHLTLARCCNDDVEEQRACATLGRTYLCQAESFKGRKLALPILKKAESAFLRSLEVCNRLKTKIAEKNYAEMKARLLLNIGLVCDSKKDLSRCLSHLKEAVALTNKHNFYEDGYRCMFSLSAVYLRTRNYKEAVKMVDGCIQNANKANVKTLKSEAMVQKAKVLVSLEEYRAARRILKKAFKLSRSAEKDDIKKFINIVTKVKTINDEISNCTSKRKVKELYEKMGDTLCLIEVFGAAIENYHKMLSIAEELDLPNEMLIPIYVSLAQTYSDNGEFGKAAEYFYKELECRSGDKEQECRTWLNIAEAQESDGCDHDEIIQSARKALVCAEKANHEKLQIHCIRAMILTHEAFKKHSEKDEMVKKLRHLQDTFDLGSDDGLSDCEESQKEESEIEDVDLDDITDSDESESEEFDRQGNTTTGRKKTSRFVLKRNEKGETPLHRACIEGSLKRAQKLIEQGHPVNIRDYAGWLPLHEASNHDHSEVVRYLIEQGANINDPGGEQCGGTTPLHDACSCGNVLTIQVLVEKEANILAKDDEGLMPLDCLIRYQQQSSKLSMDEKQELKSLEKSLWKKMKGENSHLQASRLSRGDGEVIPTLSRRNIPGRRDRNMNRQEEGDSDGSVVDNFSILDNHRTQLSSSRNHQIPLDAAGESDDDDVDEDIVYGNPLLEKDKNQRDILGEGQATKVYQDAMKMFGSSAQRMSLQSRNLKSTKRASNEGPALVAQSDYIDEDWMIDDLPEVSHKRKRPNIDSLFTTSGTRKKRREDDETSQRPKKSDRKEREKKRSVEIERMEDDPPNVNTSAGRISDLSNNELENDMFNDPNDVIVNDFSPSRLFNQDDDVIHLDLPRFSSATPSTAPSSRSSTGSLVRQTQQMRLTGYMSSGGDSGIRTTSGISSGGSTPNRNSTTEASEGRSGGLLLRVKVKIQGDLLLIPVPNSDGTKTIGWLRDQVIQRYYSLRGLKPVISLKTKDGALLSSDDFVSFVLNSDEELEACFQGWDLPPLKDRYTEACKALSAVPYRNIKTILEATDGKTSLTLENLGLRMRQIHPVLRAIQCQSSLKELHLSGNRLDDAVMSHLATALKSLINLTVLDLSSNSITAEGLKPLVQICADAASSTLGAHNRPLHILDDLRLSHNPLGDGCAQSLAQLLTHLPSLGKLATSSCELSAKLFQHHHQLLTQSFQTSSLEKFDISSNDFGFLGIDVLLKMLNPQKIHVLDIGHTIPSPTATIGLGIHVENFLKQQLDFHQSHTLALRCPQQILLSLPEYTVRIIPEPTKSNHPEPEYNCSLQELIISDCHLSKENIECVIRGVVQSKCLRKLDVSHNQNFSALDFVNLFTKVVRSECPLEDFVISGTGIQAPLDTDFLDALADKLNSNPPLRHLLLTCPGLEEVDVESLTQLWLCRWENAGQCKVNGASVELSVKNL